MLFSYIAQAVYNRLPTSSDSSLMSSPSFRRQNTSSSALHLMTEDLIIEALRLVSDVYEEYKAMLSFKSEKT